jgi:hypothetical protein
MFKYIKLLLKLKDIAGVYFEEKGKGRPFWMSRRFIGVTITSLAACVGLLSGVDFNAETLNGLTDNISAFITAGVAIYGAIMTLVGYFKSAKRTAGLQGSNKDSGQLAETDVFSGEGQGQ